MYLIGAELTGKTGFASIVLVQRVRKNLKKYYHVLDIQRFQSTPDARDCIDAIACIYKDASYTIRKPRFSQIGRPKKIVNEKPLVFVAYCEGPSDGVDNLKHRNIPANCVLVNDEDNWYIQVPGRCLKSDFSIPKRVLIKQILAVIEDNRLVLNSGKLSADISEVCEEYRGVIKESVSTHHIQPFDDLVLALAMPVWYYENLLSIRPRTP